MLQVHTDREFEDELVRIEDSVTRMAAHVETMIADSIRAYELGDAELAERVMASDAEVDRLEVETDELCLRILARRQPMGSDLRFVTTALKIVTDIERIGDLCSGISEWTVDLAHESHREQLSDITAMAHAVRGMMSQATRAFATKDAQLARAVIESDRSVDAYYAQVFRQTLDRMVENKSTVSWASRVQAVAKNLERIGDHATNLAEMVVFMVQGRDIRHPASRTKAEQRTVQGILFLCVHNAARSQIAEAWARALLPQGTEIWSAGSAPSERIDNLAIHVMAEAGIDVSVQRPKRISDVPLTRIDTVITLCAEEICVTLPGVVRHETWEIPDPTTARGKDDALRTYRQVRDEIKHRIENFSAQLGG